MSKRERGVAVLRIVGMSAIAIGLGGAFGWPFALLSVGAFTLLVSFAAS